ncbi:MAG: universal stress protein [Thermoplasmata archaeon]|nr:universal stress protein [Thermoplasmata archaeon]
MGRMLVACDGSEHSRKALDKAISMAGDDDEIVVLYVIPTAILQEFNDIGPDVPKSMAQDIVNQSVDIIKARGKKAIAVVREGDIADEIIHFAKELECSLILIGSVGMSKIGKFALGSVAEKVARNADRAVLIIK